MPKRITIAIPTYKRPKPLKELLLQISATDQFREAAKVLVVNDSGTDQDNLEYRREILEDAVLTRRIDLTYLENDRNEGFPRTFARLIEETKTPHVLIMADDDLLIEDHFSSIMSFLDEKDPDLCSPWWISRKGEIGRGGTPPVR